MSLTAAAGLAPMGALGAAAAGPNWAAKYWDPERPFVQPGKALKVQAVLMYRTPVKKEATSWKSWGGVQTEESAAAEVARIAGELKALAARAEFPMEVVSIDKVMTTEQAVAVGNKGADVTIVYPATGSGDTLRALIPENGHAIVFLRKSSGPVYYWFESLSVRYLKTARAQPAGMPAAPAPRISANDVVVDDPAELLWRLRAFYGVKNFLGAKIVALGGARGKYDGRAPQIARERYKLNIVETDYVDFEKRISSALKDPAKMALAEKWTEQYLKIPGTTLDTARPFVVNGFALYGVFKDLMAEHGATAFTIGECMGTIMPMSQTTACLSLGLLNDEGLLAFCESDFVIVPAGMLLRHISGKPVFLHNSTFPHNAMVTCAHCTGPRRMDGMRYEPTRLVTHYESDYGAAPKVEMPVGQEVSFIDPEYATGRWVGMKGKVEANPFYEICRSQQDVRIEGNWKKLLSEVRDSHWVMVYGDYLREIGVAAPRIGVTWDNISET
ncbi:MAG: sugar isomerase [Acidobacteria bacterium]|nr:sugar isomerase [Acidobacteriota bacterium]